MKHSRLFITVLLSLFMFQSIWNVAAAFCVHDREVTTVVAPHFGHHSDEKTHAKLQTKNLEEAKFIQYLDQISSDDHSDHLPSMANVFLVEFFTTAHPQFFSDYLDDRFLDWNSLYQSPHLYLPKLPPINTPL